ncbi:hypothetical protein Glove_136g138 [Diversispora epigaea]|uniref:Uncharacterized protein n=1 Tax=Diversispora epigaea TaxID=1348612 RepID=A0A397J6L3_9GLOM|nr:hypothetical protein Glove_136g138 [Diversispora epigaea]
MSSELDLLRQENAKLMVRTIRKRKCRAQGPGLQNLEQTAEENTKLKNRSTKLKQKQTWVLTYKQDTPSFTEQSHLHGTGDISPFIDKEYITPDLIPELVHSSTQSPEDKEVIDFLDSVNKKNIHQSNNSLTSINLSCDPKTIISYHNRKSECLRDSTTVNKIHDQNLEFPATSFSAPQTHVTKESINKHDLKQELSAGKNINYSYSVTAFGNSLLDDEKQDTQVTAQNIICMFRKAIQSDWKEILHWYHYRKISSNGKVKIKTVKSMVYKEVKQLLPDITDTNLRQKTLRARKIYLFNSMGIEKIEQTNAEVSTTSIPTIHSSGPDDLLKTKVFEHEEQWNDTDSGGLSRIAAICMNQRTKNGEHTFFKTIIHIKVLIQEYYFSECKVNVKQGSGQNGYHYQLKDIKSSDAAPLNLPPECPDGDGEGGPLLLSSSSSSSSSSSLVGFNGELSMTSPIKFFNSEVHECNAVFRR